MNANTYEQTLALVVGEFGKQTKAKIYEWIDANAIVVKDRKNKTKEDLYKVIATFKMQTPAVVYNPCIDERCEDCSYCSRTKPCSCDCGLLGGSCKKGYFLDTGGYFDDDVSPCGNCGVPLDDDMHIFCFSRGDEEKTFCKECGDDCHKDLKADGWIRDDDEEDSEEGSTTNEENSDEEEEKDEYMEEDMGECPKCDCSVKRKDLAWRIGYYLDICSKCDEEEESEEEDSDDDVPVVQLIQRKVADNKQALADLLLEKNKKKEELKQINRAISDLKRNPKKRAEEKMVPLRPTYNLAEKKPTKQFKNNSQNYTLFRHNKPVKGWCKYALYNSKNNNYMECNFDGEKVTDWANGKIHKTLNAWTTSNLLEQCARENKPRKTVKNNAYKETNFIYMNLDEKKMIYTSAEKPTKLNPIAWLKSIILIDKQSELAVDWTYEKVGKKTKAKMVYVENK
jgi:hypothetical protein